MYFLNIYIYNMYMYFVWICWCQILVVTMCQNRQAPSNLPAVLEKVVKPYQWGTHLLVMEAPPALCPGDNPWKTYEKPEGFAWLISEMVIKHGKKSIPPCISVYICIYIIFSGFSHCIIFAMNDSPFWGIPQYTHTHFFDKSMCPCVYTRDYIYIFIFICIIDCSYTFSHAAKFACQDLTVSQQILHTSKQFNAGVVHIEEHLSICIDKLSYPTVNGTIKRNHQTMGLSQVLELSLPAQPRNVRCTPLSK